MRKYIKHCIVLALLPLLLTACKHDDLEVPDVQQNYRPAADFIKNNYDLSLFSAAIEYTGMTEELNSMSPITIMAPSNTAFAELGINRPSDFNTMNTDSLRNLLRYHVLNRRLMVKDLPVNGVDVRYETLYEGKRIYTTFASHNFDIDPKYGPKDVYVNGSHAGKKDITLFNGILFVVSKVFKYTPGTVQEWLSVHPEYSVFVAALKQFNLWEQLSTAGPYTVFAPDNSTLEAAGITAATLETMGADKYSGDRLFGVYILPKKQYFITDFAAFNTIYGTNGYTAPIPNDTCNYSIRGSINTYLGLPAEFTFTIRNPEGVAIREVTGNVSGRNDNLTDNGIVHFIPQALYLPEEAKK